MNFNQFQIVMNSTEMWTRRVSKYAQAVTALYKYALIGDN